jgi:hypothetical protein
MSAEMRSSSPISRLPIRPVSISIPRILASGVPPLTRTPEMFPWEM